MIQFIESLRLNKKIKESVNGFSRYAELYTCFRETEMYYDVETEDSFCDQFWAFSNVLKDITNLYKRITDMYVVLAESKIKDLPLTNEKQEQEFSSLYLSVNAIVWDMRFTLGINELNKLHHPNFKNENLFVPVSSPFIDYPGIKPDSDQLRKLFADYDIKQLTKELDGLKDVLETEQEKLEGCIDKQKTKEDLKKGRLPARIEKSIDDYLAEKEKWITTINSLEVAVSESEKLYEEVSSGKSSAANAAILFENHKQFRIRQIEQQEAATVKETGFAKKRG